MSGLKSLFARFRKYAGDRRTATRYVTHLENSLTVYVYLADARLPQGAAEQTARLVGYTRDLSEVGLGIVLSELRLAGRNIAHPDRKLRIRLGIPPEPVEMQGVVVRHIVLDQSDGVDSGYLVGVQIKEMSNDDRARYLKYLNKLAVNEEV